MHRLLVAVSLLLLAACTSIPANEPSAFHCDRCFGAHRFYWSKANPLWWPGNADDPDPDASFAVGWPEPLRVIGWYVRNPLHNLFFYVLGEADQPTVAYGIQDIPARGCGRSWTRHVGGGLYWPWIACGGNPQFYAGWRPGGGLGFAFRANSGE